MLGQLAQTGASTALPTKPEAPVSSSACAGESLRDVCAEHVSVTAHEHRYHRLY